MWNAPHGAFGKAAPKELQKGRPYLPVQIFTLELSMNDRKVVDMLRYLYLILLVIIGSPGAQADPVRKRPAAVKEPIHESPQAHGEASNLKGSEELLKRFLQTYHETLNSSPLPIWSNRKISELQLHMTAYDWKNVDVLRIVDEFYSDKSGLLSTSIPNLKDLVDQERTIAYLEMKYPGDKIPQDYSAADAILGSVTSNFHPERDKEMVKRLNDFFARKYLERKINSPVTGWGNALQRAAAMGDKRAYDKASTLVNEFLTAPAATKKNHPLEENLIQAIFAIQSFRVRGNPVLADEIRTLLTNLSKHNDIPQLARDKIKAELASKEVEN